MPLVSLLHEAWLRRRRLVIEMAVDPAELREPEVVTAEPYDCDPGLELGRERLQFLTWTNSYDARASDGEPIWWHGRRAARLGATEGGPADVVLPDGSPAWCDGGPSEPLDPADLAVPGALALHRWAIEAGSLLPGGPRRSGGAPTPGAAGSDHLAPDQLAAVAHAPGPARVIAPAGSGKTRVLTARLRHLLADRGVHPSTITAVAFNRKAVGELTERTADLRAAGFAPHVRTIHSLGLAICNGLGGGKARGRRRVVDERESRRLLESLTHTRPVANTDVLAPYLEALSMVRIGLVDPEAAEAAIPDAQGFAAVFPLYREALERDLLADFDEQIYSAITILLTDPDARHGAQALARHLLVDECQDLAPAHLLLLRLVAAPTLDCFGVGDDDQCIYGYAGADPDYLISFERYFPGARAYALEVGYRCPPAVVAAASNLLSHNARRIAKATRPAPGRAAGHDDLQVRRVAPEALGPTVATQVGTWRDAGVALGDMAVLARVNAALLGAQVALTVAGIPCTAPLDVRVLDRTGMRTALAYLRIATDPAHVARADIAETIRRPPRRIARNVVEMLTKPPTTGIADIRRLAKRLSGADSARLASFADDLSALPVAAPSGTAAVLRVIRGTVGLGDAMDALDGSRGGVERSSHSDDLAALEQVAALHPAAATFEAWLREVLGAAEPDRASGRVQLSSVHRVKGMEWARVILIGAAANLFPHALATDTEEERRIFHVALTRGRSQVLVLADSEAPSPFVAELATPAPPPGAVGAPTGPAGPGGRQAAGPGSPRRGDRDLTRAGRGSVTVPGPASGAPVTPGPGPAGDRPLADALRAWRLDQSRADGVPAYVIFTDEHLEAIARARPSTLPALARCKGMGPIRLERYGDAILAVVEAVAGTG